MKRYFFFLCIIISVLSCSKIPNQSILEPLKAEQIARIIDNDPSFSVFYEDYWNECGPVVIYMSELDKAKFLKITYRDLYKSYKYKEKLYDSFSLEWEKKYNYDNEVDSTLSFWEEYKENNTVDKYVKIDYTNYTANKDYRTTDITFLITPLQGPIDGVLFKYYIIPKAKVGTPDERNSSYLHNASCDQLLDGPNLCTNTLTYLYGNSSKIPLSEDEFNNAYSIETEITHVIIDGENVTDYSRIPACIRRYWYNEESDLLKQMYKKDIIKELIDPHYITLYDYANDRINEHMSKKYPDICSFYEYIEEKNNKALIDYIKSTL